MTDKLTVQNLVERNRQVATQHQPLPFFSESTSLPSILIYTCADPRCVPERFLDLKAGEAVVVRNVAGHVAPNLLDAVALDVAVGGLKEVMVIHHTDCGALHFKNDDIRQVLRGRVGDQSEVLQKSFGAISDIEQGVRDDCELFRSSPLIRKELASSVSGYIFDVKTGLLTEIH